MIQDLTQYAIYTGILLAVVLTYYLIFLSKLPSIDDWLELPYLKEYLEKHPECKTTDPTNPKCCHCNSNQLIFQPLVSNKDRRLKHICTSCQSTLFRSRPLVS